MKKEGKLRKLLLSLEYYIIFFLLFGFVISCAMILFLSIMAATMELTLTPENIAVAAKLTFGNVLLLTLVITVIDRVRRKKTVDLPAKRIAEGAARIMAGDFSVRIPHHRSLEFEDRFNEIIDCFNTMAGELAGMETLRTDFIANVSHELKTPLAVIQNYGMLLQQPGLTEEQRLEYAGTVSQSARQLADLVTNILKLNKLENQQIFPEMAVYDLGEQLCACLLAFEALWEEKELEIETELEEDVLVRSDPELLSLVWNNLFSNAMKFTDRGGRVSLSLKTDGPWAVVQVRDTGCGISREVGARMFDQFYQGDTSHTSQGNGLGLTLVKRVVDITGSSISVDSQVGVGSAFTIKVRREPYEERLA